MSGVTAGGHSFDRRVSNNVYQVVLNSLNIIRTHLMNGFNSIAILMNSKFQ